MIPKVIHYCWFGGSPLPDYVKRYIDSWRKYCPDYEIIEWNEGNFDIKCCAYVKEAYEAKKWAFVTDYVRLYVLYHHGGIYMDTDVEVVKPFDNLLKCHAFMCFENSNLVSIGTLGAVKESRLVKDLLENYEKRHFFLENGNIDLTINLHVVTSILKEKYNLKLNGRQQVLKDKIYIYPMEYFIAKSYRLGWIQKNEFTYAIHHYDGSWVDNERKIASKKIRELSISYMRSLEKYVYYYSTFRITYEDKGLSGVLKLLFTKLRNSWKLKNI